MLIRQVQDREEINYRILHICWWQFGLGLMEEAKYRAMADGSCKTLWIKIPIQELGFRFFRKSGSIILYCDSTYTLHVVNNPMYHKRMKYIEADCHCFRERRS